MIQKIKYNPQVNKLRVINNFEADFNLVLTKLWPKLSTHQLEREGILNEDQWGTRPRCSVDHPALIDELITEIHHLTCKTLAKL